MLCFDSTDYRLIFRLKKHLVRVRKSSGFGLKYLVLLPQNQAGNCPDTEFEIRGFRLQIFPTCRQIYLVLLSLAWLKIVFLKVSSGLTLTDVDNLATSILSPDMNDSHSNVMCDL